MRHLVVWWIKRDIRLSDNQALLTALERAHALECPLLALWICEPEAYTAPEFHVRREKFVLESLAELEPALQALNVSLCLAEGRAVDVFRAFSSKTQLHVFSHQETGVLWTFERDLSLGRFFKEVGADWTEFPTNGVVRGLRDRNRWQGIYQARMKTAPLARPNGRLVQPPQMKEFFDSVSVSCAVRVFEWRAHADTLLGRSAKQSTRSQQKGGERIAHGLLQRFLSEDVHRKYVQSLSKPRESQYFSSRLSPYLAFGCISSRQILNALEQPLLSADARSLSAFRSRLAWRCHFTQKLENFPNMESREQNAALSKLRPEMSPEELQMWQHGLTGYPLVDACLRSVHQTGFLNFRMRAMLMSFATHLWWKDWRIPAWDLARAFLDFEPGIHFAQVHMQAAVTGNNQIRIYNPIKQSSENDSDARFIKQWVPELRDVASEKIHLLEALPSTYVRPVVDLKQAMNHARDQLFKKFKEPEVRAEARVVQQHLGSRGGPLSWRSRRSSSSSQLNAQQNAPTARKSRSRRSQEIQVSSHQMTLFDDELEGSGES